MHKKFVVRFCDKWPRGWYTVFRPPFKIYGFATAVQNESCRLGNVHPKTDTSRDMAPFTMVALASLDSLKSKTIPRSFT